MKIMNPAVWLVALTAPLFGQALFGQALKMEPAPSPAGPDSLQANWSTAADGSPLLSWVEKSKDGFDTLRYAVHRGSAWSEARTIAAHRHFFHHPAELPEVIALSGGPLLAHWVELPKEDSEAEFLYVSASADGVHWSTPRVAHKDTSLVQHGLGSMAASGPREASLIWLQALKGEDGPVTLMRTVVSAEGAVVKEETLDPDVCACCPTSVVRTAKGLLVAYRDHTPANIRDISTIRLENGHWSASKNIFPDNWKIDACPVNAATAAAKGDSVAVAWYTASSDKARVEMALSSDDGATFGKASTVSTGQAYGYTSTAMDDSGGAIVSWLERGGGAARVLVRRVSAAGVAGPVLQVAQGDRAALGYPRMLKAGGETWIAWGNGDSGSKVSVAILK
ncbi:MAG TPA: exo-alpha-sialidase [Bryobacteraceae bacterium]|jgi:hypothetical protein|nr:exo-alpha-sialidase [Bryobacteraceae bacterium]